MGFDVEVRRMAYCCVEFREKDLLEIDDLAAPVADQMVVWRRFGLEPVEGAACVDLSDLALPDQDGEVSVHRAEAEAGKLRFQPVVEPRCGGMGVRRAKQRQKPLSLAAVSIGFDCALLIHCWII